jgi:hypothetical protein
MFWDSVATVAIATSTFDLFSFELFPKDSLYTSCQNGAHGITVLKNTYHIETDIFLAHKPGSISSMHLTAEFLEAVWNLQCTSGRRHGQEPYRKPESAKWPQFQHDTHDDQKSIPRQYTPSKCEGDPDTSKTSKKGKRRWHK